MTGLLSAWLVEAGIVSWRAWKRDGRPPLPSEFVPIFVVFGGLALLAEVPNARGVAAITGWGIVLASAFSLVDPTDPLGQGQRTGAALTAAPTAKPPTTVDAFGTPVA